MRPRGTGLDPRTVKFCPDLLSRPPNLTLGFGKHIRADQYDAAFAAVEALVVELRVLPNHEVFRDANAAVDNHIRQMRIAADLHLGQQHCTLSPSIRVDPHAEEQ